MGPCIEKLMSIAGEQGLRPGYDAYRPLFELKPVAANVWVADGPVIWMKLGILRLPFPTRMTIVRWAENALWLHSPIAPRENLVSCVEALGRVSDIVAPNNLHLTWTADWSRQFPDARVWSAPCIPAADLARLPFHRPLGSTPPLEWHNAFDQVVMSSGPLTEVDFFHLQTRTLILTDVIENLDLGRFQSLLGRAITWAAGSADPHGMMPWELRQHFRANRVTNRAAVERMIEWAPERILLAHGRCYDRNCVAELQRAFRWL
jgi:Domain of unknown function (DUF4336)